ncbi:uncharacterized protein LOC114576739 [Exaiptasia diaphana]|uniref:Uncharacterized protein n=1 Tax=Exaiptasia diaphana TaxID=2652724 RepID=A0A913Z047_EXADI|nr:uncharacterized protein LOC114576739 [Exaiptasia diaphana]
MESKLHVCLRVLRKENKSRFSSYSIKDVPNFDNVQALKDYLLERCSDELSPATDSSFQIGYFGDKSKKFSISNPVQLAEALSMAKKGMVTLWVDPHGASTSKMPGKKRKASQSDEEEEDPYEIYLKKLREKHGSNLPEFKIRCWARMLVYR